MKHLHFYKIAAKTHFELGCALGKLFKSPSLFTYNVILSKMLSVPSLLEKTSALEHDKKKSNTIARFVFDRASNSVDVWLKREKQKGWITYSVPHI